MRRSRHALFSASPVGRDVPRRVGARLSIEIEATHSLGELRQRSPLGILHTMRAIRADELWVLVSSHGHEPLLPLLLLLAALTSARRIHVVDHAGETYSASRGAILAREPMRLLGGTSRGLWDLLRTGGRARKLLAMPRLATSSGRPRRHLAYLGSNLWPGIQAGGSVGHVAGVVNALHRRGCAVEVYAVEAPAMVDPEVTTVPIVTGQAIGIPPEIASYTQQRLFAERAAELMAGRPPDLLYQRHGTVNLAGVTLARRFGLPLVLEYNGSEVWAAEQWGRPLTFPQTARLIEDVNLRHAHLVVVVSQVLRQELLARGVPDKEIVCHPNGIDPQLFDPDRFSPAERLTLRRSWGFDERAVVCLFLGTFGAWHGTEVLAEAVRRQAMRRPGWFEEHHVRFVFVGDGANMPKVRATLADVPSQLYCLTGLVRQAEAPACLAAADILLSPHVPNPDGSRFFGSPTKLFEYMAMGKAIVASELEQIGEILEGSPHVGRDPLPETDGVPPDSLGLLTAPGSAEELVAALEHLAPRPALRARLGAAARARVLDRFTWDRHVGAILERVDRLHDLRVSR